MISEMMRKAAGFDGAPVGERQALLSGGADVIDALVAALETAMPYLRGYAVAKRADAALALARLKVA